MKVYVFGNRDIKEDKNAFLVAEILEKKMSAFTKISADKPEFDFKLMRISDEINFENENPVIMDVVLGIDEVTLFDNVDEVELPPRVSAHDFDLGFQLKYLKKIGKIKEVKIIGIPMKGKIDYERIIFILRKLVAQDIQGS